MTAQRVEHTASTHEGCFYCGNQLCDQRTCDVDPPVTHDDDRFGFVLVCPSCGGVDVVEAWAALEAERDLAPEFDELADTRAPYDVAECWACEGQGDVVTAVDRDGIPLTRSCPECRGTGMRGAA